LAEVYHAVQRNQVAVVGTLRALLPRPAAIIRSPHPHPARLPSPRKTLDPGKSTAPGPPLVYCGCEAATI